MPIKTPHTSSYSSFIENPFAPFQRSSMVPAWVPDPVVAVLMPIHNQSEYLEISLKSVISQIENSFKNTGSGVSQNKANAVQIYIINDGSSETGSPDSVRKILTRYENIPGIFVWHQENKGLPLTLGRLTEKAYSNQPYDVRAPEFACWHSGDNFYEPGSLRLLSQFMTANPDLSLCFGNMRLIDENGNTFANSDYRKNDQVYTDTSVLDLEYPGQTLSRFNDNFIGAGFMYRTELDRLLPAYQSSHKGFEDYRRWLQLQLMGNLSHIGKPQPIYNYRLHKNTLTTAIGETLSSRQRETVEQALFLGRILDGEFAVSITCQPDILLSENSTSVSRKSEFTMNLEVEGSPNDLSLNTKNTLSGSFSYECVHRSHLKYVSTPAIWYDADSCIKTFAPSFSLPGFLMRARKRNLGAFEDIKFRSGTAAIFCPSSIGVKYERIISLIVKNRDLGVILITASDEERAVADSIYLGSELAHNLRITDIRLGDEILGGLNPSLLNALGSVDAVISLSSLGLCTDKTTPGLHPVTDSVDFSAEAALSAAVMRPLLADTVASIFQQGSKSAASRTLPHVYPWNDSQPLPDLVRLKTDLDENNANAVVRYFSGNLRKRQIIASILINAYN